MPFRNFTLRRKLVGIIFLTSLLVLFVTCLMLFYYEIQSYRRTTVRNLSTVANIITANSSAVLVFDDPKLAREILYDVHVEPEITAAALYSTNGTLFATYPGTSAATNFPASPGTDGIHVHPDFLTIYKPVIQTQSRVGTLFLKGDLKLWEHLKLDGLVLLMVLAASGAVGLFLSNFFQRQVSRPLLALAGVAKTISEKKDYSVRAMKTTNDEIGDLTEAFNSMLAQIQTTLSALSKSEERFSRFMRHLPGLAWIKNRNGKYIYANVAAQKSFGKDAAELYGRTDGEIFPANTAEHFQKNDQKALESEAGVQDVEVLQHPDGTLRYSLVNKFPIREASGETTQIGGIAIDITERKLAEDAAKRAHEQALAASRAKDDFLAALSHELRTPLNPVLLVAGDAAANPRLPPEVRAHFEMIRRSVELEAKLIDDLLDLTRVARGKLSLDLQPVDVHHVLREAINTVRADAKVKKLQLALDLRAGRSTVVGDEVRLQQVFWNVLKNAVKFTPEGGRICISTFEKDDRVVIKVTDTGIGIKPEDLPRVFDAFSQGDHAGSGAHRFGGLGLGLAISRMLVELHSGRIRAESAGNGMGATFFIELPLAHADMNHEEGTPTKSPAPMPPATAKTSAALPRRILLVEDHQPTRAALAQLLSARRYQVTAAGSLAEARRLTGEDGRQFDLVISDIGLPDGDGCELMAELRNQQGLKGIALTGYGMEQDIARSRAAGFVAHLTKPVRIESLDGMLAAILHPEDGEENLRGREG